MIKAAILVLALLVAVNADMGGEFQIADEDVADGERRIGDAQGLDFAGAAHLIPCR